MIRLLCLLPLAFAHMPDTSGDNVIKKDMSKSWGVYRTLGNGETLTIQLDLKVDDEFSFSINLPTEYDVPTTLPAVLLVEGSFPTYVNVTLTGHGLSGVTWVTNFSGWDEKAPPICQNTPTILSTGHDDVLTFTPCDYGKHYEPFGVGGYRSIMAAKGDIVTKDNHAIMVITSLKDDLPISVGVGMVEAFDPGEVFLMSLYIRDVWIWSGYDYYAWISIPIVLSLCSFLYAAFGIGIWGGNYSPKISFFIAGLVFNLLQFFIRIIAVVMTDVSINGAGLIIHVFIPLLCVILWLTIGRCYCKSCCKTCPRCVYLDEFIFVVYATFFLWQGFFFIPITWILVTVIDYTIGGKITTAFQGYPVTSTGSKSIFSRIFRFKSQTYDRVDRFRELEI